MTFAAPDCKRGARWDATILITFALLLRLGIVAWGAMRFPPAGDGQYYDIVAHRIARGEGYTWLWPDGAVTYAAHYPVGYPAVLGGLYALFGASPIWAMLLNALAGITIVWAVHRIAVQYCGRRGAWIAAGMAAIHPTFLFYTPALMTEQLSAALSIAAARMALSAAGGSHRRSARVAVMVASCGIATLVRPQQLLFAPFFGFLYGYLHRPDPSVADSSKWIVCRRALIWSAVVTSLSMAICLPWTLRNCARMGQCVFVSANAGWNLLIGTSSKGEGAWTSIDSIGVPETCRTVYAEAAKDKCFGQAASSIIRQDPMAWVGLAPKKLQKTFDDIGAPGWYLHASSEDHFGERAKVALGAGEVVFQRGAMALGLIGLARVRGARRTARLLLAAAGIACLFYTYAWVAVVLFCIGVICLGRNLFTEPVLLCAGFAYATTAVVHAVFFGGARYAIVAMPFMLVATARACSSASPLQGPFANRFEVRSARDGQAQVEAPSDAGSPRCGASR